jgi:pantetheine-phosphate adenylyltransferase
MARQALQSIANVRVQAYDTLTVDFVRQQGAEVIVRGLRVISDFEMEYQMALTNRSLNPSIDSVCLMTSLEHAFISSSIVKDIAAAGGSVDQFVPLHVLQALRRRLAPEQSAIA